jgi:hypothetical protein
VNGTLTPIDVACTRNVYLSSLCMSDGLCSRGGWVDRPWGKSLNQLWSRDLHASNENGYHFGDYLSSSNSIANERMICADVSHSHCPLCVKLQLGFTWIYVSRSFSVFPGGSATTSSAGGLHSPRPQSFSYVFKIQMKSQLTLISANPKSRHSVLLALPIQCYPHYSKR